MAGRARRVWRAGRTSPRLRVYCSDQAHSSIDKAAHRDRPRHRLAAQDPVRRGVPAARRRAGAAPSRRIAPAGVLPMAVVATVGTTSTTSIDPVPAIADICAREGVWLHVDAAYGGVAAMLPSHAHVLGGAEPRRLAGRQPAQVAASRRSTVSAFYCRRMDVLRAGVLAHAGVPADARAGAGPEPDGHRRTARPPFPRAQALDGAADVRGTRRSASTSAGTSSWRSSWPAGSTSTPTSSAWRRCP